MAKKKRKWYAARATLKDFGAKNTIRIEGRRMADGREAWRVTSGDRVLNLTTSTSSTAAIDEAVKIYDPALKRLAKQ